MNPTNHTAPHQQVMADPSLGLGAKGLYVLMAQLLEHDPNTAVMTQAREHTKDGDHRIAMRMKELEQAGYVQRRRDNAPNGKICWRYELRSPKRATKRHVA